MSGHVTGTLLVMVVHYNTPALTTALVRTLPRVSGRGRRVEVHILDNNSRPDDLRLLREGVAAVPGVYLTESASNLGFGAGHNHLLASSDVADADVLWLLNPDTRLIDDCLSVLEAELDRGVHAVVSPVIVTGRAKNLRIWYAGGRLDERRVRVQHLRYGEPASAVPEATRPFVTEFVTGAAPMLRAGTLRAVGGFPADYFLYWEDALLSWAVRRQGHSIAVVPAARIWHAVGASSGTGQTPTFYYWSSRNRVRFARDAGQRTRGLLLGAGTAETLRILVRAAKEKDNRGTKLRAALRGVLHGIGDST